MSLVTWKIGSERFVEAKEDDVLRIGAPPEGVPTAIVDFLEVDPARLAVADRAAAVGRQLPFGFGGDVGDAKVVVADVGDEFTVGTELRRFLFARRRGEPERRGAVGHSDV